MKMKFLSVFLAIVMLTALTACGDSPTPDGPAVDLPSTESSAQESASSNGQTMQTNETLSLFNTDATLAETVLMDENGIKITATDLTYTAYSVDLALTIENNSGQDLTFVSGSLGYSCNSVNGYMISDGYLNCDVANGKKANDTISFSCDALKLYGIKEIADMEIGFSMTDDAYNTTYSGPRQLKTSVFETHDYETDHYQETITSGAAMSTFGYEMKSFSQDTLYDQNGVALRSSGVMTNRDGETALLLELENTTGNMVYLSTSDITINGLLINSSTWSNDAINPGKRCIVDVNLASVIDPACGEVYGVTEVGAVSLSLSQRNAEGVGIAEKTPIEIIVPDMSAAFDGSGTEVYNSNGVKMVLKTVMEDPSEYSSDLYVLLLAENSGGKTISIDDAYGSLSVNGFMTDYSFSRQELGEGESGVLMIELWESSLEKNEIVSASDIQEIEVGFEVKEGYKIIDEPTVTLIFGQG